MVLELEKLGVDLGEADAVEVRKKYELVKAFEKALKKPCFMVKQIKERDCPIHERWCSLVEAKNVDRFLTDYIVRCKEEDPTVNPFDRLNEISVVFPTVDTMDLFQMLNDRKSYKADDIQWTGYSELYTKIWPDLVVKSFLTALVMRMFLRQFDDHQDIFKMFNQMNDVYKKTFNPEYNAMTGIDTDDPRRLAPTVSKEELEDKFIKDQENFLAVKNKS